MKQYYAFFKIKVIASLQYRAAAIAGVLTQFFFGFTFIMVYYAFYNSNDMVGPMEFSSLVTYIWLQQAFYALTYAFHKEKDIITMIKDGNVAYELCRPGNLYLKWYTRILASKYSGFILRFLPIIIITSLLPYPFSLGLPINIYGFIGFLITLILASFLITAIVTIIHILMFYTIDSKGILTLFGVITELFSGTIVPIPFLPNIVKQIATYLPFQYIADVPYRLYTGDISYMETSKMVILQILWILIMMVIGYFLSRKVLKKAIVQGG